ncbi:hypothetical protein [Allokutzneria oryzae]|uniref:Uncharacterized protein n=1 Tax=Allokutzneria oryzae TaxID=1378989 RepID=A0ABV5ZUJ1_9PSEU
MTSVAEEFPKELAHHATGTPLAGLPEMDGADWVATLAPVPGAERLPDAVLAGGLLDLVRGVSGADFERLDRNRMLLDLRMRRPLCASTTTELRVRPALDGASWAVRAVQDNRVGCSGTVELTEATVTVPTGHDEDVLGVTEIVDAARRFAIAQGGVRCQPDASVLLGMRAELHRGLPRRLPLTLTCEPESGGVGSAVHLLGKGGVRLGHVRFDWLAASATVPRWRNVARVA